jgi:hypothetical protein
MRFRWRKQLRFGPLRANLTQDGISSYTWKLGPFSWNSRTRRSTVDTPGPGYVQTRSRTRQRRTK